MTISSSLNASVSGLSSNASRLAGISDNIANSATNGYRRVETDFHSMVISNRQHAYAAGGVRSSQQRMIDQSGSLISTNNSTDLAVNGRGLLPVSDAAQIKVDNGRSAAALPRLRAAIAQSVQTPLAAQASPSRQRPPAIGTNQTIWF